MEIYRLKSFAAIAREANLTRAAERLHLSQSAVSSQLKLFEEELGLALFRRTPKGMELNEAGQHLLPFVEDVLDAAAKLKQRALALRTDEGETINIGLNADPSFLRVGSINRRMALVLGNTNLVFHTCPSARASRQLRQGLLELAYLYGETAEEGIRSERVADVRFCVVVPAVFSKRDDLHDWKDIAPLPWIWVEEDSPPYQAVQSEMERRRLQPNKAVKAVDEYIVKELVMEGQGLGIMREDEARPLIETGAVQFWEKGWTYVPLNLAWREKDQDRRSIRLAREAISYVWNGGAEIEGAENTRYWY